MTEFISHLVWLGAGRALEPSGLIERSKKVTLVEAREIACLELKQRYSESKVVHELLTVDGSHQSITEYNLPEYSAINTATNLKVLFPGLKIVAREARKSSKITAFLRDLKLIERNNVLIVDIIDISLDLLKSLEQNNQLHLFDELYITSSAEKLYYGAANAQDIMAFLEKHGYTLLQTNKEDPDFPQLHFKLNPLWHVLQKALDQKITKELASIKSHINTGLGNVAKQLEAFMGIQNYLERGVKPLSFHGWPISPDIGLYIIGLIDSNNYDAIIEFGSGTSTVLMAKALISKQRNARAEVAEVEISTRILTFEHNSLYHGKTTSALKENGVDHLVDLVNAPLIDYQYKDGGQYLYYSCNDKLRELAENLKGHKANILVLVDGPPGATNKHARFPALPHLLDALPGHSFTILMDDYNRSEEKEITAYWLKLLSERSIAHAVDEIPCEKGLALIKLLG